VGLFSEIAGQLKFLGKRVNSYLGSLLLSPSLARTCSRFDRIGPFVGDETTSDSGRVKFGFWEAEMGNIAWKGAIT
jgi:hypothetical protein